jgi:glutaminase
MLTSGSGTITRVSSLTSVPPCCGWRRSGLSRFAGRQLSLDDEIYASASATNFRNEAIGDLLHAYGRLVTDVPATLDLYAAELAARDGTRSRRNGGHARRRWSKPDHGGPGRRRRYLPVHARRDDDRRTLRDVRNLALRHRPAGQERDRRRDRHHVTRQGRLLSRRLGLDLFMSAPSE